MKNMRKGFTLIELLIVVVIIGILAAIAIPKFANTKSKAYIAAMKSDLRNLVTAEESYFSDSAKYATDTLKGMKCKLSTGVSMPTITVNGGSWSATKVGEAVAGRHSWSPSVQHADPAPRRLLPRMTRPVSRTSLRPELLINCAVLAGAALVFAVTTVMLIYNEVDPRRGALYIGLLVAADVIVVVAVGAFQIHRLIVRPLHETAQAAEAIAAGDLRR